MFKAGDIAWMLTSTALVLLMIPGVGYVVDLTIMLGTYPTDAPLDSSTPDLPDESLPFR